MKPKNLFMAVCVLCVFCVAGCKSQKQLTITTWQNTTAECCGVVNPCDNLNWLKEQNEISKSLFPLEIHDNMDFFIHHYFDTISQIDLIVYDDIGTVTINDCEGTLLTQGPYYLIINRDSLSNVHVKKAQPVSPPPPCEDCDSILARSKYVELLYYYSQY